MINFLNLEYFLAAAEELNFTRAAKRLYISQQSLSTHISNIEKEMDVILFNRTTPLTLTYAGKALAKKAQLLLDLKDETLREISDIKNFTVGQLSIGVSHTRGRIILPEILPVYQERFPNIELHLIEGNSKELDLALLHGEVDLIIGMLPFVVENVETVPICEEEILIVVPDKILKRYFPDKIEAVKESLSQKVSISLLKNCPFLLINKGNRIRTIADEMFEEALVTPNVVLETENIETVMALSLRGMGITFYSKMFLPGLNLPKHPSSKAGLNFYSLNYSKAHGTLAIGYPKGRYLSQATKEFIRIAKENI